MAQVYNGRLIAELYGAKTEEQAVRISDEMAAIGDAIFPRQIYQAYKRFVGTSKTHYFVTDLTKFTSPEASEILKEIARNTSSDADIAMMVTYLKDIADFDSAVVGKVKAVFDNELAAGSMYEFELENYIGYLEKAGFHIASLLQDFFEDERQKMDARKYALNRLLKIDSKKYLQNYIDNYARLLNTRAEIIFAEEVSIWKGGMVPRVHKKILEAGSERAREILSHAMGKTKADDSARSEAAQKEIKAEYETADIISDIATLRSRINKITNSDERFGFSLFSASEEIYEQNKPAKDKPTLIGYCMSLRPVLGAYDDRITKFELSKERALELIPDLTVVQGSINKLHLFLLQAGIDVDDGIFGLRNLNRIITKFAAHTDEEKSAELIEILKSEDLYEMYRGDSWSRLHRGLLVKYKEFLIKLLGSLTRK